MEAIVIGTAQDAGLPQVLCACPQCDRARREPAFARTASGVAVVGDEDAVVLLDASPDMRAQWATLPATSRLAAVALTHAHMGHITGLLQFGKEGPNAAMDVHATPRLAAFLRTTPPFAHLFPRAALKEWSPGEAVTVAGVTLTPHALVHRGEISDTVAIQATGARRSLLYLPDTDAFDAAALAALRALGDGDVALVDGTFFDATELPGRDLTQIPHPFVADALDTLGPVLEAGVDVVFTHLNHSNPLADAASSASKTVADAGFKVARDGDRFPL